MSFLRILAFSVPVASQVVNHANWHQQYPTQYKPSEFEEIRTVGNAENPNDMFCVFCAAISTQWPECAHLRIRPSFRPSFTKFHKNRKKTMDAILPRDGR